MAPPAQTMEPSCRGRLYPQLLCLSFCLLLSIIPTCLGAAIPHTQDRRGAEVQKNTTVTPLQYQPFPVSRDSPLHVVQQNGSSKIVGGVPSYTRPWMVSIGFFQRPGERDYFHICGGALIAPNWVLTAAHCTDPSPVGLTVFIGGNDLRFPAQFEKFRVISYVRHAGYNSVIFLNDIALIRLSGASRRTPVTLNGNPNLDAYAVGRRVIGAGWGALAAGKDITLAPIRAVSLPLAPYNRCSALWKSMRLTQAQLCAGGEANRDTCQGDSGGPIHVGDTWNTAVQVGITSYGNGCGLPGWYGVYTRVYSYLGWIRTKLPGVPLKIATPPPPRPVTRPAPKPVAKPVAKPPVAKPVAKPPVAKPVAKPPVAKPVAQPPVAKPVAKPPVAKPVAKPPVARPVVKPPAAKPPAKPVAKPVKSPGTTSQSQNPNRIVANGLRGHHRCAHRHSRAHKIRDGC